MWTHGRCSARYHGASFIVHISLPSIDSTNGEGRAEGDWFPQMPTRSASHLTGSVNSSPIVQGDFEKRWHEQERRGQRKRDENNDGHSGKTMAAMPVSLSTVTDVEPHGSGDRLAGEQVEIAFENGTDTNVLASANPPNDGRWVSGHNTVERRADALHDGAESHGQSTLVAQASSLPYDMRQLNKVALCASPTEPFVGATGNEFSEVFHDSRFNPDYIFWRALWLGGVCVFVSIILLFPII